MKEMSKKERVLAALNRQDVDRTPVANPTSVATVEMMDLVDAPFPEACRSAELNAKLAATEISQFDFDSIAPYFSIIQESSAIGCEMQWEQKDNWPTVRMSNPIWKTASDVKVPANFLDHPDVKVITDSIRILKKEFGDEVPIIGKTMGPWTLAYHVFGVETFLLGSVDNPDETAEALEKLGKKCNITLHTGKIPMPKKILVSKIKNADGLVCHPYDTVDKDVISNGKNLKAISTFSVGFDHIDVKFAKEQGIKIGFTPEVLTNATAELTIGLVLDLLRRISEGDRIIRHKKWNQIYGAHDYTGVEISGKTIGIMGMGRIGREVAKKATGLGMNVIYHSRNRISKNIESRLKAKYVSASILYQKSDIISLHIPYSKDTHHLMNSKKFQKVKKTSFLINTSRGKIVNEKDLAIALKKKQIRGAGVDVYELDHQRELVIERGYKSKGVYFVEITINNNKLHQKITLQ